MISRHWKGIAKPGRAADCIDHLGRGARGKYGKMMVSYDSRIVHYDVAAAKPR